MDRAAASGSDALRRGAGADDGAVGARPGAWGRRVKDCGWGRGTELGSIRGRSPTSLITDPTAGRMPSLTAEARAKTAARAADARQHQADGPEDRSLQERFLSFNAGPP